ncbi:YjeJ family protein, partial [Klebsiella pneumoniae]
MQGTFIGFNTAGITFEDRFLALLLKIKQQNGPCQQYYLQAPILLDLLLILQNRLLVTYKRLHEQGETYKEELIAYNESLIANIPAVEMAEIQQPNPERRIMSITLKPGETESTLILVLQNEQICTLCIEDRQVEALLAGVQQALKTINDQEVLKYLSSNMDFLMCYTVDLTTQPNIDYQQHTQEDWKLNLFSHYLGVLYCCETDEGKKIVSGAVVKTSAPHLSELENNVVTRIIEKSPKLKAMHAELAPCQIFSTIIPSQPGRMLSLEECLRPLHAFYLEGNDSNLLIVFYVQIMPDDFVMQLHR